jgi:hypothetical protein
VRQADPGAGGVALGAAGAAALTAVVSTHSPPQCHIDTPPCETHCRCMARLLTQRVHACGVSHREGRAGAYIDTYTVYK